MNIAIANRLVALRKANGLSQEALAEKLGLSRQAISKWERAEASPDTDNLMALAQLYGITLDDLLSAETGAPVPGEKAQDAEKSAEKPPETALQKKAGAMFKFPFPLLVVILYLALGFIGNLWHPTWLLGLLIPIYYHLAGALKVQKPKARLLAMPVPEAVLLNTLNLSSAPAMRKYASPELLSAPIVISASCPSTEPFAPPTRNSLLPETPEVS